MTSKDPKDMNLEELQVFTASLVAQEEKKEDEHKDAMEDEKKNNHDAMDEEKKNHESQVEHKDDEHKEAMKALRASLLSAMEEKDEEKKEEAMKAVLQAMDEEHKKESMHKGMEDKKHEAMEDEEKKAMKATITYLSAAVNKPKIDYLNKIYTAAKTEPATLTKWNQEWEAMNPKQLDGAIAKAKPLVDTLEYSATQEEKSPFGFPTVEGPGRKEYSADKSFKKIDEMSDEELFRGSPYA